MDNIIELNRVASELYRQGKYNDALDVYKRLAAADPANIDAWSMLGVLHAMCGNLVQAEKYLKKALKLDPSHIPSLNNLGNILRLKKEYNDAENAYNKIIDIEPGYTAAYNNLGILFNDRKLYAKAINALLNATRIAPEYSEAYNNLAVSYYENGNYEQSLAACNHAIRLNTGYAEAYNNRANALLKLNRPGDSISSYKDALAANSQLLSAHHALAGVYLWNGNIKDAIHHYKMSLLIDSEHLSSCRNLAFCLNYDPGATPAEIYNQHIRCGEQYNRNYSPKSIFHNSPDRDRTLRIGYVSADFREHPVTFFFSPIVAYHDNAATSVYCYSNSVHEDSITDSLKSNADVWCNIKDLDTEAACSLISNDRIDILVDLSGYTDDNRLDIFASRPAPVQVTYLGYPNTTGLRAMDYRISDMYSDPPEDAGQRYTEKLVRLEKIFAPYTPPDPAPDISELPALSNRRITIGSLHAPPKLNDEVIKLWSTIIQEIPGSRLLLYRKDFSEYTIDLIRHRLHENGLDDRQFTISSSSSHDNHLVIYNDIDISLDPFPWSSHTTTCESLWMGVPVVTLYGNTHAGRMSASVMRAIGLEELITHNRNEYINTTKNLANDVDRLVELRSRLRDMFRQSPMFDYKGFVAGLEIEYRQMWNDWLEK